MKRNKNHLDRIRIAQSCSANWDSMSGDKCVRFCDKCEKIVYNLSSMTSSHAEALLQSTAGQICARFERLEDGAILTQRDLVTFRKAGLRAPRISSLALTAILSLNLSAVAYPLGINNSVANHLRWQTEDGSPESQSKGSQSSLAGTLFDPNQAVVTNAKVTITREGTDLKRSIYSSEEGRYQFRLLEPGTYTLAVEVVGFNKVTKPNLSLKPNQQLIYDISLVPDGRVEMGVVVLADETIEPSKVPNTLLEPLSEPIKRKKPGTR
jgi:Carboxypeptidase regulatory-like domain